MPETKIKAKPKTKPATVKSPKTKTVRKDEYIYARGRRRTACARVRVYLKHGDKGNIVVNEMAVEKYFPGENYLKIYLEPLRTCNLIGKYFISAKIKGSGKTSQVQAFVHALSRALVKLDEENFHSILKKRGFLTRDQRMKERRKIGTGGKARRQKQSPKR